MLKPASLNSLTKTFVSSLFGFFIVSGVSAHETTSEAVVACVEERGGIDFPYGETDASDATKQIYGACAQEAAGKAIADGTYAEHRQAWFSLKSDLFPETMALTGAQLSDKLEAVGWASLLKEVDKALKKKDIGAAASLIFGGTQEFLDARADAEAPLTGGGEAIFSDVTLRTEFLRGEKRLYARIVSALDDGARSDECLELKKVALVDASGKKHRRGSELGGANRTSNPRVGVGGGVHTGGGHSGMGGGVGISIDLGSLFGGGSGGGRSLEKIYRLSDPIDHLETWTITGRVRDHCARINHDFDTALLQPIEDGPTDEPAP
jgi:hypothetical protein